MNDPAGPMDLLADGKGKKTRDAFLAGGVLLFALGVRLASLAFARSDPYLRVPLLDAAFHHDLARGAFESPPGPFLYNPLYPWLLKGLYALLGSAPSSAALVQAGLGAVGAELAYLAGRRWLPGFAPGLCCGLLAALYGPFLFYENLLLGAAPAVFLVWLLLLALPRPGSDASPWRFAPPGAALALAALLRPTLLLAAPALALFAFVRTRGRPARQRGAAVLFFSLALLLPLLPTLTRNAAHGSLNPVALHGGVNFYIGNRQGAGGSYERPFPGPHGLWGQRRAARDEAGRRAGADLDWAEADRFWYRAGLREVLDAPGSWAALTARKVLLLLNDAELPLNYNYAFQRERSPFFSWPWPGFGMLTALAAAGGVLLRLDRRLPAAPLLFLAFGGGATVLFFVTAQYRLPLVPPLILLAGFGLAEGVRALATGQLARLSAAAGAAAVAAAVAWLPAPVPDHAGSWRILGDVQRSSGRLADALRSYERSLSIRETSAAWNNKGTLLLGLRGGKGAGDAEKAFRAAIRLDPGNRQGWNNLGVALMEGGDADAAAAAYEDAIARFPGYESPVLNLARLYWKEGDRETAQGLVEGLARYLERFGNPARAAALRDRWRVPRDAPEEDGEDFDGGE